MAVKVYIHPIPSMSIAMLRVAHLLQEFKPGWVQEVSRPEEADIQILHVIGNKAVSRWMRAPKFAVIQYCVGPLNPRFVEFRGKDGYNWTDMWRDAELVWSYYDLRPFIPEDKLMYAPLGVPKYFAEHPDDGRFPRNIDIFTSGYMSGPGAEAIEEVALAAKTLGKKVMHLGPTRPKGMRIDPGSLWHNCMDISDEQLSLVYKRSKWVSGLRQVEGFEYPVIEGLVSGARPIVFDRSDMREWYSGHAVFIPVCHGQELVDVLINVLKTEPKPVSKEEQDEVLAKFNRGKLSREFWSRLRRKVER